MISRSIGMAAVRAALLLWGAAAAVAACGYQVGEREGSGVGMGGVGVGMGGTKVGLGALGLGWGGLGWDWGPWDGSGGP